MKTYRKQNDNSTFRTVKSDNGIFVGIFGNVEDLFAKNMFTSLPPADAWEWCFIDANGNCEFFDEREEVLEHLRSLKPQFGE